MQGGKRVAVAALLIALIATVVFYTIYSVKSRLSAPPPPPRVTGVEVEKIDVETLELVTKTLGEWEDLGHKAGKYKNPNTGRYTMTPAIECSSCGQKIPPLEPAEDVDIFAPGGHEAIMAAERAYKCPRCGEQAIR